MTKFNIEAMHEDDIFDLRVKELHVNFRKEGVDKFPKEYIDYPKTLKISDLPNFQTALMNTWLKRNRNEEALKVLENALEKAKKQNNTVQSI